MKNEEEIDDSSLSKLKNYEDKIDNIEYDIKIGIISSSDKYKNNIYINCTPKNLSKSIEYILIISLESLMSKSNKMFNNCSSINEAFDNIIYIFNNKTYELKMGKDLIKLILKYNLFGKEIQTELELQMRSIDKIKLLEKKTKN